MANPTARLATLACLLLASLNTAYAYSGVATAYGEPGDKDSTGKNACGFGNIGEYESAYAAVGRAHGLPCGSCANVCGANGCAKVMIIDACASCGYGHIDLSANILQATTGFRYDRKPVTWNIVPCEGGASTQSASSGSSAPAAPAAPAAPVAPPPCPFTTGQWVRCPDTGDIFQIENGQRRYATVTSWQGLGSPAYSDYRCIDISYCPLGSPIPEPPKCAIPEGAWVQEDEPSQATYFMQNGALRLVDYAFWAGVGSPTPARVGNAALAICAKGAPLTAADLPQAAAAAAPAPAASTASTTGCALKEGDWVQRDLPSQTTLFFKDGKLHKVDYAFWAAVGSPATTRPGNAELKKCTVGEPITLDSVTKAAAAPTAAPVKTPVSPVPAAAPTAAPVKTPVSSVPAAAPTAAASATTSAGCPLKEGDWVQRDLPSQTTLLFKDKELHKVDYAFWAAAGSPATTRPGNAELKKCIVGKPLTLSAVTKAATSPSAAPAQTATGSSSTAAAPTASSSTAAAPTASRRLLRA